MADDDVYLRSSLLLLLQMGMEGMRRRRSSGRFFREFLTEKSGKI